MKRIEFLKDKFKYIIFFIIIITIVNIYLFSIDIFEKQYEELLYLNFLILIITLIFFIIDYINLKNKYRDIQKCIESNEDIDKYLIKGQSIEENIMKAIIENLKSKSNEEIKEYKKSLKELDEYMAKWIHEIKIPISALNMISDRLNNVEDSIDIKNQVAKINFLVNSILYSSRSSSMFEDVFFNKVNLDKVIKSSIKNNSFLLIKNNIEVSLENLDYTVFTDIKCISYILDQIINNAIKYSKEEGKIEFTAKDIDNGVVLSIKDYGIGINEEDIGRVFDKGFTGSNGRDRLYKSTGMGLYFAKNMVDKLGHKIEINSQKDKFTSFNIYFYDISGYLNL